MENAIGDDGATTFANAIISNKTVKELNITKCKILDMGAVAIANSLLHNTKETVLVEFQYSWLRVSHDCNKESVPQQLHLLNWTFLVDSDELNREIENINSARFQAQKE